MAPIPTTTIPPVGAAVNSSTAATATASSSATPLRGNTTKTKSGPKSGTKRSYTKSGTAQTKKRPYRRTKRPKNYCDKSTVTTVTTPTQQTGEGGNSGTRAGGGTTNSDGTNVYDAVLGECEDLLRASTEAQRLGRLKMASAYQLLLHTRLVGLGKRFDRSAMMVDHQKAKQQQRVVQQEQQQKQEPQPRKQLDLEPPSSHANLPGESPATTTSTTDGIGKEDTATAAAPTDTTTATDIEGESPAPASPDAIPVPAALQHLKSILPGNLEMDASMMEHLARAAVELHHQRTGRKKSADGLLASPLNGGLATSGTTVATAAAIDSPKDEGVATTKATTTKKSSVAWTPSETAIIIKALKEGKDYVTIASTLLPNKTVPQVYAFVKNQQQLHKVNKLQQGQQQQQQLAGAAIEAEAGATTITGEGGLAVPLKGQASDPKSQQPSTAGASDKASEKDAPPTVARRGGRGRKPPTTAMNTVPNISMDVRALLRKANNQKKGVTSTATASSTATESKAPPSNEE